MKLSDETSATLNSRAAPDRFNPLRVRVTFMDYIVTIIRM